MRAINLIGPRAGSKVDGLYYKLAQFSARFTKTCEHHAEGIATAFAEHDAMPDMLRASTVMAQRTTHDLPVFKWSAQTTSFPSILAI